MGNDITKNTLKQNTNRNTTIDVFKGIGIILMVVGHSGFPKSSYIYLFHMAIFFLISGYMWSDKKVETFLLVRKGVISRIKGLWLPFTITNIFFTLLNNVFVYFNIYSENEYMNFQETLVELIKNVLFCGDTIMGGATWFLRTMFCVSVANYVIRYIATHWKLGKIFFLMVSFVTLLGAEIITREAMVLPIGIHTCFAGYSAFLFGMLIKRINLTDWINQRLHKAKFVIIIFCALSLVILYPVASIGLAAGNIGNILYYFVVSMLGFIMVWEISTMCKGRISKVLSYCGRNSIWIITLHFLAFKLVSWIYIIGTGNLMENLSQFPVISVEWLWIAYTLVGGVIPLLIREMIIVVYKSKKICISISITM